MRILYGGSVNAEFISQPQVYHVLIGGASAKADQCMSIVRTTAAIKGI